MIVVSYTCNGCSTTATFNGQTYRSITRKAAAEGWRIGVRTMLCPECRKDEKSIMERLKRL